MLAPVVVLVVIVVLVAIEPEVVDLLTNHVPAVRIETSKSVPFDLLSLPLCPQRTVAIMTVSVAVAVDTLLPRDPLLTVRNLQGNAGLTLELLLLQRLLQTTDATQGDSLAVVVYTLQPQNPLLVV